MAKVAVEKEGATTIVSIDRFAEARNAVDPETAILLREAFLAFDADEGQSVAILTGRGGTFCAGYDLKVAATREGPALHDPAVRKALGELGVDLVGSTPAEFSAYIKAEIPKWRAVVQAAGGRLD